MNSVDDIQNGSNDIMAARIKVISLRATTEDAALWNRAAVLAGDVRTLDDRKPNRMAWIISTLRKEAQRLIDENEKSDRRSDDQTTPDKPRPKRKTPSR